MITNNTKFTISITADEAQYILERVDNDSIKKKIRDAAISNGMSEAAIHRLYNHFINRKVV